MRMEDDGMTREKAIDEIKNYDNYPTGLSKECRDFIIKALEQLPKLQNRCYALTHGQLCVFCPYECKNRSEVEPMTGK